MTKGARPLHERLRGLDADERCAVEVLSSVGIGDVDCPRGCGECIAKAFEAMADEIERNYELREGAYTPNRLGIGADGLPICEGDEMYVAPEHARECGNDTNYLDGEAGLSGYSYGERRIAGIHCDGVALKTTGLSDGAWCPASWLTHTPPDTQERIDKEKRMRFDEYWECAGFYCGNCPNDVDPAERYGVLNCNVAQGMDIARRQAELDALLGGDA